MITNQVLKDADCRQIFKFKVNYALVFSQKTLKQFKDMMTEWVIAKLGKKTSYFSTTQLTYKSEQIRLWKLDTEISLTEAFEYVKNVCNKYNSYDYRIEMKGKSLEKDLEIKIEELNLKENEYLIVEVREENKGWSFMQEGLPSIEKCEYCNRYEKLTSFCACKKVTEFFLNCLIKIKITYASFSFI